MKKIIVVIIMLINITSFAQSGGQRSLKNIHSGLTGNSLIRIDENGHEHALKLDTATIYIENDSLKAAIQEQQILSISNDTIFLSDGGFVKLDSTNFTWLEEFVGNHTTTTATDLGVTTTEYTVTITSSTGDNVTITGGDNEDAGILTAIQHEHYTTAYDWGDWSTGVPDETMTFTNKSGNISQWTNDSGYLTSIPVVGTSTLGGLKNSYINMGGYVIESDGDFYISDYYLNSATPTTSNYISFSQGGINKRCTIETLLGLGSGSMTYPDTGIAVSTGSAWGTSITDNSTNWNTAYTYRLTSVSSTSPLTLSLSGNVLSGSISEATTSVAGTMSASDKAKFDDYRDITPQSITTAASLTTYCNFYTTASSAKTITFSNVANGVSGNIRVTYSAAAVITFACSDYTIMIADNIYNNTTGQVLSKSSGDAVYSYYIDTNNSKIYINGTQTYH